MTGKIIMAPATALTGNQLLNALRKQVIVLRPSGGIQLKATVLVRPHLQDQALVLARLVIIIMVIQAATA